MNADKRIQWLHKYIVNMRYPNASRLAERFGISHRQAQRDVTSLREDFGAPLAYSADHRGFYYTQEFSLPSYTTDESEFDPSPWPVVRSSGASWTSLNAPRRIWAHTVNTTPSCRRGSIPIS